MHTNKAQCPSKSLNLPLLSSHHKHHIKWSQGLHSMGTSYLHQPTPETAFREDRNDQNLIWFGGAMNLWSRNLTHLWFDVWLSCPITFCRKEEKHWSIITELETECCRPIFSILHVNKIRGIIVFKHSFHMEIAYWLTVHQTSNRGSDNIIEWGSLEPVILFLK
jgi:hypothetical protein